MQDALNKNSNDIEIAMVNHLSRIKYIIVPNLSWGMFGYELDLCALNIKSFYATEIEIKISKSDLKRDSKKYHNHDRHGNMIRYLYFAMPDFLIDAIEFVPQRAGIFLVNKDGIVTVNRKPETNTLGKKWTYEQAYKLGRLGTIRMWNALENIKNMKNEIVRLRENDNG